MSIQEDPGWGQESCWLAVAEMVAPMRFLLEPAQGWVGFLLTCIEAWLSSAFQISTDYQLPCSVC